MKYLAIDHGTRRTGLAVCDAAETICWPFAVIETQKNVIAQLKNIIEAEHIEAIVLGVPVNMDGSYGKQAQRLRRFAKQLQEQLDVPVHFQDERLSSFAAEEKLAPAGLSRKKKAQKIDAVAAAHILEVFLQQKKCS